MDDEQTLTFAMENLKRLISSPKINVDDQDSSPKPERKKAKLCYVKLETDEGS